MALADINGYKAYWFPNIYDNILEDTSYDGIQTIEGKYVNTSDLCKVPLPYRLLYPKNYDSNKSYPLLVWFHGTGSIGYDNTSQITTQSIASTGGIYSGSDAYDNSEWECFVLVPQVRDAAELVSSLPVVSPANINTIEHITHRIYNTKAMGHCVQHTAKLIESLMSGSHVFYPEESTTEFCVDPRGSSIEASRKCINTSVVASEPQCNIDSDRIYVSGWSLGGSLTVQSLRAFPDLYAAAVPVEGFFHHTGLLNAASERQPLDYYRETSSYYENPCLSELLCAEYDNIQHIPLCWLLSEDFLYDAEMGAIETIKAHNASVGYSDNILLVNDGRGSHVVGNFLDMFDEDKKIDVTDKTEQSYSSSGISVMDWLMLQTKQEPQVNENNLWEESYFTTRSVVNLLPIDLAASSYAVSGRERVMKIASNTPYTITTEGFQSLTTGMHSLSYSGDNHYRVNDYDNLQNFVDVYPPRFTIIGAG